MLSTLLVVGVILRLWCAAHLVGIAHHSFYSVQLVKKQAVVSEEPGCLAKKIESCSEADNIWDIR